ncbi:MAG: glycoside hydrolase family 97 protein [Bacteroidaceae bacterium]|nr:glycoside hydrolase family 97 protein [Bacteroidaceae bacterium]
MKTFRLFMLCMLCVFTAQAQKQYKLASPDGKLQTTITAGGELTYDITLDGQQILEPSPLSMTLDNGEVWGENDKPSKVSRKSVNQKVASPFYRATEIAEAYNELTLQFRGNWNVIFRAYNDGIAYRFVNKNKKPFNVVNESVNYRFPTDATASVPYVRPRAGQNRWANSFENYYENAPLSKLDKEKLIFLPLVVSMNNNVKVCITEVDLENYPGLYVTGNGNTQLTSEFAPYPKRVEQGGHNMLQLLVKETENFIAKVEQPRNFPWRVAIVTENDKDLASCNLGYLLAEASRLDDISWIKPGKIAWDWWNAWNLDGVDFKTGINNATYKAYIDFASKNGIEYVILDEGWAVNKKADLMQVVPEINLEELVAYANSKNVGLVLWAGYYAFDRDMENVCRHYAEMGIKGFKVDFMDRDDQEMTAFNYRAAKMAAKYKLILDLHGTHKPAGLNRTYPNVLNFEGVNGLEQMKWETNKTAQVEYDVMLPFIRQVSGPMDYTQGAMKNVISKSYYPCYYEPMSQGTRCRQLALYMTLDPPFNMLCDTPSNYEREPECTEFISTIPTVWDETVVVDGKMGEYIITARRSGDTWYIGGLTNWNARDLEVDLSFLGDKAYNGKLFKDGVNAHRVGRDYKSEAIQAKKGDKVKVHLAPGGGFALVLK